MVSAQALMGLLAGSVPWLVSLAWLGRSIETVTRLGSVPDLLLDPEPAAFEVPAEGVPLVSVIVPACNEQDAVATTVRSLLASRGVPLEVIAVNDRSTDHTPAILDALALEFPDVLRVVHVRELPEGWLGKPHALAQGVALARAPFLLFTDADIVFRDDALVRALAWAQREHLDHLILATTPITRSWGEKMMIGSMQALSAWAVRLWKIADPQAKDSIGVGSFGLLRREAYEAVGGWDRLRLEVLEDLRLGWEVKRRHHLRQGIAFGRGLLTLHWGAGVHGLIGNMTKNGFALFRYRRAAAAVGLFVMAVMAVSPIAALFGPPGVRWSAAPFALALALLYGHGRRQSGIPMAYALLFPLGALLFVYALARSVVLTLRRGGVVWRGTLYPLELLRRCAGPLR